MKVAGWKTAAASCFLAALLALPAIGSDANTSRRTAMPGTLNYIEGQASLGDQSLSSKDVGNIDLQNGQVLETGNGKAEILLTPGVYLRLGNNSSVRTDSNGLADTRVSLQQGEVMLEVDQLYGQNDLRISQPGADTRVEKKGLYDFDANDQQIRVFDGKAVVRADDRNTTVKKNHEVLLASAKIKSKEFDKDQVTKNDDLYRWSSLRSQYLSEANADAAQRYYVNGWYGPGWWGPGWYWDPFYAGFTFLPGSGYFYSPFGWGFYSPLVAWRAPYIVGRGYGYHHFDGSRPIAIGHGFHNHAVRSYRGGYGAIGAGRMRAGGGLQRGGGFHGSAGVHGGGGRR
jgi:FecR protein